LFWPSLQIIPETSYGFLPKTKTFRKILVSGRFSFETNQSIPEIELDIFNRSLFHQSDRCVPMDRERLMKESSRE